MRQRLERWTKILAAYFGAQSAVQLLGILAGILFVRHMSVREFALYTLALSVVTFFTFLSDLGATSSLVHFFHRTVSGEGDFERYTTAVLSVRRGAFLAGAGVVAVAFPWAAMAKGYGGLEVALATVAILAATWFQIVSAVRLLVLRLRDRYRQSYGAEIVGGALRLLFAGGLIAAAFLPAWAAAGSGALAAAAVALLARDRARNTPQPVTSPAVAAERRQILRYLLPTLPSGLYFALQGTLVVWLAAAFGQSQNVAQVGALSRLGLVVGLFGGLTGVVFLPRLARIVDQRLQLRRTLQFAAGLIAVAGTLFVAARVAPGGFLWVLGETYSGLDRELALVVAGAGMTLVGGYFVAVNMAHSWNRWQGAAAGVMALGQAALVAVVPLGTVAGVLWFNLWSAILGLTLQVVITSLGFSRPRWVRWAV